MFELGEGEGEFELERDSVCEDSARVGDGGIVSALYFVLEFRRDEDWVRRRGFASLGVSDGAGEAETRRFCNEGGSGEDDV